MRAGNRPARPAPAILALVLLISLSAGCLGSDEGRLDAANATDPASESATNTSAPTLPDGTRAPTTLAYRDCREQMASFPVPASAYEDQLPEGFSLAPYGAFLPTGREPTGAAAELVVAGSACTLPDGSQAKRAFSFLFVGPPDAWEDPDATWGHALLVSWITTSEERASVYEAWGLGSIAATGDVSLELVETPAARTGTVQATSDGASLTLETTVGGQPFEAQGDTGRLFAPGEEGTVEGAMTVDFTTVQVALGDALARDTAGVGTLEAAPAQPGLGLHSWGFDEALTVLELGPRGDG